MGTGSARSALLALVVVALVEDACARYAADATPAPSEDAGGPSNGAGDAGGPLGGDADAPDGTLTDADAGPLPASCKEIRDADAGTGDGVYTIAGGLRVYCDMTLDTGGWLLIANVPLAPKGYWEQNASTSAVTTPITNLATLGMLLPDSVDRLGVAYSEVLFTDTLTGNWFTVDRTSAFYLHNYRGTCGDSMVLKDHATFAVRARSSGSGNLSAYWESGCPNTADTVLTNLGSSSCNDLFVGFDLTCAPPVNTVRVRAYVR
jgi:hypothetical protein